MPVPDSGILTAARIFGIIGLLEALKKLGMPADASVFVGPILGGLLLVIALIWPMYIPAIDAILGIGFGAVGLHTGFKRIGGQTKTDPELQLSRRTD